ncbi:hypothetical protein BKA62DRAFT_670144 [Auriculariales sp. MPI-PUGE-AT-0066]|nr:hypothetical protein BKA62DRAFT_670144 [Auriculariales sp. MPI-PUGE-AT-0066]
MRHAKGEPYVHEIPYAERPLKELCVQSAGLGQMLSPVGPHTTTLDLQYGIRSTVTFDDLASCFNQAPKLAILRLCHFDVSGSPSSTPAVTQRRSLMELWLAISPIRPILLFILGVFPEIVTQAKSISIDYYLHKDVAGASILAHILDLATIITTA